MCDLKKPRRFKAPPQWRLLANSGNNVAAAGAFPPLRTGIAAHPPAPFAHSWGCGPGLSGRIRVRAGVPCSALGAAPRPGRQPRSPSAGGAAASPALRAALLPPARPRRRPGPRGCGLGPGPGRPHPRPCPIAGKMRRRGLAEGRGARPRR